MDLENAQQSEIKFINTWIDIMTRYYQRQITRSQRNIESMNNQTTHAAELAECGYTPKEYYDLKYGVE